MSVLYALARAFLGAIAKVLIATNMGIYVMTSISVCEPHKDVLRP